MTDPTSEYFMIARDTSLIDGKPKFTGFKPKSDLMGSYVGYGGSIDLGRPLVFEMDELELRREDNWPGEIGALNVLAGEMLVGPDARNVLQDALAPGMELYPAVLQHFDGTYLEPFYYLNIWKDRDVWDRQLSVLEEPFDPERDRVAYLEKIVLDAQKIASIPLNERLIIQLGTVTRRPNIFHASLVEALAADGLTTGAKFYPLAEWFPFIHLK